MYSIRNLLIFILFLATFLNAKELEKVSIQLDWLHQFQFAGYYIAKEKGFYKDEGLDVTIKELKQNKDVVENVLNSKSQYGVGKSSLIVSRLNNKKVVLLSAIYQNSPMVLISKKSSNINYPNELKNKRVMLTPDARSAANINSMIISQGLKLEDVKFQKHSFDINDLINGKTDAMGCYLSNEPYLLEKRGIKYDILDPSDYGFDFYGGIFFTSQKELDTHPKRVKKMYEATLKGWKYAFNHIQESAQLIFEKYNTQNKSLDALIYEANILKRLSKIEEGLLGNINKKKIEEIQRLYTLLGFAKKYTKMPKAEEFVYNIPKTIYSLKESDYIKNKELTLLSNQNFPPFTMISSEKVTGIEIDYWKLIVKKLDIKNSNIKTFANLNEALKTIEENDSYVKYAFSKKDLNKNIVLSDSIAKIKLGIVTLTDKPYISDIIQLKAKRVAVPKYALFYKKLKKKHPEINFVEVEDINESFDLLKEGSVYALVNKMPTLNYMISNRNLENMKIAGSFDEKFDMRLSVNKDNKLLLELLNSAISKISEEQRDLINSKYYSIIFEDHIDYEGIYKIVLPLLIILIFIIRSNRLMNKEIKRRKEVEKELKKVANVDSLTKIYNRRKINSIIKNEVNRAKRYDRNFSIIFFDIDNFKLINDNLGHSVGDDVLIDLSNLIKNSIRKTDYFGRWGGEEFIIILPETNRKSAENIAYLLKDKINKNDFNIPRTVTCSFGVTQFEENDNEDTILTRVDKALYHVKRNGKNNIKVL
ncbi:transporter substrate-binding domain-containing diguanylate cyclase [Halarcobacter anaerophilus]|uniref:diguanylate cyclase n=1 Tax=Halarcobacter anaerophilus TaxID=877500 RepID=A0A4Q0Y0D5_9BACT|nr:ABC transporter substrate-binding protein [Halarcobacter anaerophilus]QDF29972.1 BvgS-like domain-containing diguanylate cyclase (NMT1 domain) [Halarcobacter anaerophilus]RXJ63023.1 hypothetical protein CRV06_07110 [Halarcobacter anaerophilus]